MKCGESKPEREYTCTSDRPDDLKRRINYLLHKAAFTEETLSALMNISLNFYFPFFSYLQPMVAGGIDNKQADQIKDNLAKTFESIDALDLQEADGLIGKGRKEKSPLYKLALVKFICEYGIKSEPYIAFITGINDKRISGWRLDKKKPGGIYLAESGDVAVKAETVADAAGKADTADKAGTVEQFGAFGGRAVWHYFDRPLEDVEYYVFPWS